MRGSTSHPRIVKILITHGELMSSSIDDGHPSFLFLESVDRYRLVSSRAVVAINNASVLVRAIPATNHGSRRRVADSRSVLVVVTQEATQPLTTLYSFVATRAGIAASLAHPGGNVAGATIEAAGNLWLGFNCFMRWCRMGVTIPVGPKLDYPIDDAEQRRVFVALTQRHADGLMVSDDFENFASGKVIVELAEKNRLPAIYPSRLFVEAGRLMFYGADVSALGQRVAAIVGQIPKGMKPAEIPIFSSSQNTWVMAFSPISATPKRMNMMPNAQFAPGSILSRRFRSSLPAYFKS